MANELERLVDTMLCPGALLPAARAHLTLCADGMWHCSVCGRPVLIRFGRVSLHGRPEEDNT